MTRATQEVLREALLLSPVEKAELIEGLFRSFEATTDHSTDAAWATEAESLVDAHDAGKVASDTAEAVLARINRR